MLSRLLKKTSKQKESQKESKVEPAESTKPISFRDFEWTSEESRNNEWTTSELELRKNVDTIKLRRNDTTHSRLHSYLMVDQEVLVMAGKKSSLVNGSVKLRSAKNVKLAEDKDRGSWAIKIIEHDGSKLSAIQEEARIAADLKMAMPCVTRSTRSEGLFKTYLPYVYAGITLENYLSTPHKDEEYIDIALSLIDAITRLHSGELSKSKTSYAHGDLHTSNITVDKNNKVHLIDYGATIPIKDLASVRNEMFLTLAIVKNYILRPLSEKPEIAEILNKYSWRVTSSSRELITIIKDMANDLNELKTKSLQKEFNKKV